MTELVFSEDSYLKTIDAKITKIEGNAIITNRTIFYAESGGQPGDSGEIKLHDQTLKIIDTKMSKIFKPTIIKEKSVSIKSRSSLLIISEEIFGAKNNIL